MTLPATDRDGVVSLADYRGKQPVLLAPYRSLYCPFCRRQMSQLAAERREVRAERCRHARGRCHGARTCALVLSIPSPRFRVAADPDLRTHRAYGLPHLPKTPAILQIVEDAAVEMARDLGIPTLPGQASDAILRFDGFEPLESDRHDAERDQALMIGQFLIDPQGIVRWVHIERTPGERLEEEQVLAAL